MVAVGLHVVLAFLNMHAWSTAKSPKSEKDINDEGKTGRILWTISIIILVSLQRAIMKQIPRHLETYSKERDMFVIFLVVSQVHKRAC